MAVEIIVSVGEGNNVIGINGDLPWPKTQSDIRHLHDITMNHPVAMGRKTLDSLNKEGEPFPSGINLVLSRSEVSHIPNGYIISTPEKVLRLAKKKRVFIIGGAEIYNLFMPYAEVIHLTLVHRKFNGDTYFPVIMESEWYETSIKFQNNLDDPHDVTSCTFMRRKKIAA